MERESNYRKIYLKPTIQIVVDTTQQIQPCLLEQKYACRGIKNKKKLPGRGEGWIMDHGYLGFVIHKIQSINQYIEWFGFTKSKPIDLDSPKL